MLLKLEGFRYATSLDLNMGYYHIRLDNFSKKLCTLILPWEKSEMQALPMGLSNSPDIFQEKMNELMHDLEFVRFYIDDILIVTSGTFEDHLNKLDQVLSRLSHAGLKTKAKIVLLSTRTRISRILDNPRRYSTPTKKIEAIKKTAPPKSKKESRSFIGLVNYYRDVWIRRSDVLAPLAKISGKNAS